MASVLGRVPFVITSLYRVVSQFESSLPPGVNLLKPDGMAGLIERDTWPERITISVLCWSSAANGAWMIWAAAGHENLRRLVRHHVPRDPWNLPRERPVRELLAHEISDLVVVHWLFLPPFLMSLVG